MGTFQRVVNPIPTRDAMVARVKPASALWIPSVVITAGTACVRFNVVRIVARTAPRSGVEAWGRVPWEPVRAMNV